MVSNRLYHYGDAQSTTVETGDLENTATAFDATNSTINTANNFAYDETGNLIHDETEEIDGIEWDVYGKIKQITRTNTSTKPDLLFLYTPTGERALKVEMTKNTDGTLTAASAWAYTAYMRDASGNVMNTLSGTGPSSLANEYGIYGSNRLGTWSPNIASTYLDGLSARGEGYRLAGDKTYELTNHLGNVMVTVNDKKLGYDNNADYKANTYHADVLSMNDYYAFGMPMPGRAYSSPSYRYGFNGKEKDDETYGVGGSSYDYGFRIYNSRLGRFLSVDPLTKNYPMLTSYQFASNRPIDGIDLDGAEYMRADKAILEYKNGALQIKVESLHRITRVTLEKHAHDPQNWKRGANGELLEIGVDFITIIHLLPGPSEPSATDIEDNLTANHGVFPKEPEHMPTPRNRKERRALKKELKKNPKAYSYPTSTSGKVGRALGVAEVVVDGLNVAIDSYVRWATKDDAEKLSNQFIMAKKVAGDLTHALLHTDLIPLSYQTPEKLIAIMNVMLQGVNTTNDPKIYEIGMAVFNEANPPMLLNRPVYPGQDNTIISTPAGSGVNNSSTPNNPK